MSEYQYYEFRAIDRPLDRGDRKMLRALSKRGQITNTSFTNTYNWGDFKGDPDTLMETCFDAFVYVSNSGVRRLVFRLPKLVLAPRSLACCQGNSLTAREAGEFVVVEFQVETEPTDFGEFYEEDFNEEDEYDEERGGNREYGEGWMDALVGLRAELTRGDDRCLYLGWLLCAQSEELDDDDIEPPVPAGLKSLSRSLAALVEYIDLDEDLLEVAASSSEAPTREELAAFVQTVPIEVKNALLVDAALRAGSQAGAEILRRFELSRAESPDPDAPRAARTAGELLAAAKALADERIRLEQEREAEEEAREERNAAMVRTLYLDRLAARQEAAWNDLQQLIQTKQPGKYDLAVKLLIDLRELAARSNEIEAFQSRVSQLCQVHQAKPSLLRRISEAGL